LFSGRILLPGTASLPSRRKEKRESREMGTSGLENQPTLSSEGGGTHKETAVVTGTRNTNQTKTPPDQV